MNPARRRRSQAPVASLGARASRPLCHVAGLRPACGRDARAPRMRRFRESGVGEPEAGRRTILRRLVGDFMDKESRSAVP